MNGGPPLDPELLARVRREDPAPDDVKARVRGKVLSAALLPRIPAAPRGSWKLLRRVSPLGRRLLALSFVMGAGAGALLHASLSPRAPRVVYVDRPAPSVPGSEVSPSSFPLPRASAPPSAPPSALPSPEPGPAPARPSSSNAPSRGSRLAEERKLLDAAREALVAGDVDDALARLDRHRRQFPRPLLAEERDAMTVQALAAAGRGAEARRAAATFRAKAPASLFLPILDRALSTLP